MGADQKEPAEALEAIETNSPSVARRRVARIFQEAADADAALFSKFGIGEEGKYYQTIEAVGAEPVLEACERRNTPDPAQNPNWRLQDPPRESIGAFRTVKQREGGTGDEGPIPSIFEDQFTPVDVRHEASALLYDDSEFVGWLAVMRISPQAFESDRLRELNKLIPTAVDVLAEAECRERQLVGEHPARLLVEPGDLEIRGSTTNGSRWLNDRRRDNLKAALRAELDEEMLPARFDVDGFCVWVDELSGDVGRRFIVTVEYAENPKLSLESVLTPRQQEVVEYAAAGATNREIAETLDITPDTVSDHLSESYRRLGVANRVELAKKVAEKD